MTTMASEDMNINPQRAANLLEQVSSVVSRAVAASSSSRPVRLILVSKLKPASDILALHSQTSPPNPLSQESLSHFGENYVQELTEKAELLPRSIKWHFIGALQSNKAKNLAAHIPNLFCVSSVDSEKKADLLDKGRQAFLDSQSSNGADSWYKDRRLDVKVQVNTSGEESKSGVQPGAETTSLCTFVLEKCPALRLSGLMTIGDIARSQATTPENENDDFITLREERDRVAKELGLKTEDLELSMGMSSDFEGAIRQGSSEVRIGSTIFGERPPKKDTKVKGNVEAGE
jgi:pyridoxal phosphate enzyme (YggS family)